jgi:hypothetical protein
MRITLEIEGWPGDRLVRRIGRWWRKRRCTKLGHVWYEPASTDFTFSFFGAGRRCSRCGTQDPSDKRNGPFTYEFPRWPSLIGPRKEAK